MKKVEPFSPCSGEILKPKNLGGPKLEGMLKLGFFKADDAEPSTAWNPYRSRLYNQNKFHTKSHNDHKLNIFKTSTVPLRQIK